MKKSNNKGGSSKSSSKYKRRDNACQMSIEERSEGRVSNKPWQSMQYMRTCLIADKINKKMAGWPKWGR